jgi:hypothetical protein
MLLLSGSTYILVRTDITNTTFDWVEVKVKQFLYRPITGPKDFSWLRLPDFETVGSALRFGLLYSHKIFVPEGFFL